jgi:hypothetical protein
MIFILLFLHDFKLLLYLFKSVLRQLNTQEKYIARYDNYNSIRH